MIETSASITSLAKALLAVQKAVGGVVRDSTNPHFKNRYASLESVVAALRPHCLQAGLVVTQAPGEPSGNLTPVETMIVHAESGEWMKSTMALPVSKQDAQGIGSAITYGCRYSLMSLFNLPPVDDDAEATVISNGKDHAPKDDGELVSDAQVSTLQSAIVEVDADLPKFLEYMKVKALSDLRASDYPRAMAAIQAKRQRKAAA